MLSYNLVFLSLVFLSTQVFAQFESGNITPAGIISDQQRVDDYSSQGSQPFIKFRSGKNDSITLYGNAQKLSKVYNSYPKNQNFDQFYDYSKIGATRLVALKEGKLGDEYLHIKFKQSGSEKWYITQCHEGKTCVTVSDQICRRFARKGKTISGLKENINQCKKLLDVISLDQVPMSEVKDMDDYISEARRDYHAKKGGFSSTINFLSAGTSSPVKNHLLDVRKNTDQILGMFQLCSQWMQNEMNQEFSSIENQAIPSRVNELKIQEASKAEGAK